MLIGVYVLDCYAPLLLNSVTSVPYSLCPNWTANLGLLGDYTVAPSVEAGLLAGHSRGEL